MLTYNEVKKILRYDPVTGNLHWIRNGIRTKIGDVAGAVFKKTGRRQVYINGKIYLAHRVAWLLYYKKLPLTHGIDHRNGNPDDNSIKNLRAANQSQNVANIPAKRNNRLGIRGVYPYKRKYRVALQKNGKQIWGGYFKTIKEAERAAIALSKTAHGEFSIHNRVVNPNG